MSVALLAVEVFGADVFLTVVRLLSVLFRVEELSIWDMLSVLRALSSVLSAVAISLGDFPFFRKYSFTEIRFLLTTELACDPLDLIGVLIRLLDGVVGRLGGPLYIRGSRIFDAFDVDCGGSCRLDT